LLYDEIEERSKATCRDVFIRLWDFAVLEDRSGVARVFFDPFEAINTLSDFTSGFTRIGFGLTVPVNDTNKRVFGIDTSSIGSAKDGDTLVNIHRKSLDVLRFLGPLSSPPLIKKTSEARYKLLVDGNYTYAELSILTHELQHVLQLLEGRPGDEDEALFRELEFYGGR